MLGDYAVLLRYEEKDDAFVDQLKELYEGVPEELKESTKGRSIYLSLYPPAPVKEGDEMADADLWDLEGNMHHLSDYKGKYILLDFWAHWCKPCRMSFPELKEIAELYNDRLVVVSLNLDNKENWEKASAEEEMTWLNLNDFRPNDGIRHSYSVTGIPHYVLISPEGKIITTRTGYGKGTLLMMMEEELGL
jgi:Thiol-disulfide isomerase and thioredoxins